MKNYYKVVLILVIVAAGLIFLKKAIQYRYVKEQAGVIVQRSDTKLIALSPVLPVEETYRSMMGPSRDLIFTLKENSSKPMWITGYEVALVGPDGESEVSNEYLCHNSLSKNDPYVVPDFYDKSHFFTLSQGQQSAQLPEGFGIPVMSDELLKINSQVLNHTKNNEKFAIRQKMTIHYEEDLGADRSLKPLFHRWAPVSKMVMSEHDYPGHEEPTHQHVSTNHEGHEITGHWSVKPGREVTRSSVTEHMKIPYDTTIHYIAVHLHAFAESIEFRDVTENKTLFFSKVKNYSDRVGLEEVEYYSSQEGIPVYQDHEYEVVSTYNNTTEEDQDSMAVLFMYLLDKEKLEKISKRAD